MQKHAHNRFQRPMIGPTGEFLGFSVKCGIEENRGLFSGCVIPKSLSLLSRNPNKYIDENDDAIVMMIMAT